MRFLLVLSWCLIAPLACFAQTYDWSRSGTQAQATGTSFATRGATVGYDWEATFTLGLLLGEPVVSARLKFDLIGGFVTVPDFAAGEDIYDTRSLADLPQEAFDRVRLYDMKLRLRLIAGNGQSADILVDMGHLGASGSWSFNVPGSPDWDRFLLRARSDEHYFSADEARAIWASGLELDQVIIEDVRLSLRDLHDWYARQNPQARIDAYTTAIRRLGQGISVSYGFDLGSLEASLARPIPENDIAALQDLLQERRRQYERLRDLPGHLRITTSHAAHRQSIRDADEIVRQAQLWLRQFRPSGTDVDEARQRGSAAQFDLSDGLASTPVTARGEDDPDYGAIARAMSMAIRQEAERFASGSTTRVGSNPDGSRNHVLDSRIARWTRRESRTRGEETRLDYLDLRNVDLFLVRRICHPRLLEEYRCARGSGLYQVEFHCARSETCVTTVRQDGDGRRETTHAEVALRYCGQGAVEDLFTASQALAGLFGHAIDRRDIDSCAETASSSASASRSGGGGTAAPMRGLSSETRAGTAYVAMWNEVPADAFESCHAIPGLQVDAGTDCSVLRSEPVYTLHSCTIPEESGSWVQDLNLHLVRVSGVDEAEFERLQRVASNRFVVWATNGIAAMGGIADNVRATQTGRYGTQHFLDMTTMTTAHARLCTGSPRGPN